MKFTNIMKYIPLLATLPEGYAVWLAMGRNLDWHPVFRFIAAAVIALTGFWALQVFIRMVEFNSTLYMDERQQKMTLSAWQAGVVAGVWFIGVVLLTVFLDVSTVLVAWTPVAIVIVGGSASYLYGLSNMTAMREQERDEYRVTKKKKKEEDKKQGEEEKKLRQQQAQVLATKREEVRQSLKGIRPEKRPKSGSKLTHELLLLEWARDPFLTPSGMEKKLWNEGKTRDTGQEPIKVSRQAISQRQKSMVDLGLIIVNDDGRVVEVIHGGGGEK